MPFTFYKQLNNMDCGPACLRMVAKHYGKHFTSGTLNEMTGFSKTGVSLYNISHTAEKLGFRTRGVKLNTDQLDDVAHPCILHWNQNHYVVLVKLNRRGVEIADPKKGMITYSVNEFNRHWLSGEDAEGNKFGIALLLEPSPEFYKQEGEADKQVRWTSVIRYLPSSKWQLMQVFVAFVITSALQLIFPFLTQSIVDTGINTQNLQFVVIVLIAQLMLTFSQTVISFIRSRLLLRISNKLNIQILSDFWIKLMRLSVSYFDIHQTGDIMQRINDHKTIQSFLTGSALNTFFSMFNFVIYAIVLIIYNVKLFFIFCIGNAVYILWIQLFMRIRRKINYETFHIASLENDTTLQLIQGMQEIRLNNAEKRKRWEWENIQANIFKLGFRNLNYSQLQETGAIFINQVQGIAISFIVAKLVIDGQLTLGAMLAIQYIVGQLSGPVQQMVGFIQNAQDARISMERLNEIHQLKNEEEKNKTYVSHLPEEKSIIISDLSFSYPGAGNDPVLEDINLVIPEQKVTAIVGASGSGKTTLVKLLLRIYEQYGGDIHVGSEDDQRSGIGLKHISPGFWRSKCGAVLQDGFIFTDTIARNIAVGEEEIDYQRLTKSCSTANIQSFIEALPNGYHTKLGAEGMGISQGQRQRILIARAVYKNPDFLFFDEATNALDANNEKEIVDNLEKFFKGRTVVVVAHRLSTVKNADNIVVLNKGRIVEQGTHEELTSFKGRYYELVKNQLELGN